MFVPRSSVALLILLCLSTGVHAQFDPEISSTLGPSNRAGLATFTQTIELFEDDSESLDSVEVSLGSGVFDFGSIEVDDVIGEVTIPLEITIVTPLGIRIDVATDIGADIVASSVTDDDLEAEAIGREIDDELDALFADFVDETIYTFSLTSTTSDDPTLVVTDEGVIPDPWVAGIDLAISWKFDSIYDYDSDADVVSVTSTIISEEGTEVETVEELDVPVVDLDFMRGDVDLSGSVSGLLDSLRLLQWAFADADEPACDKAADVDDNGAVSPLLDSLALLRWQFGDDPAPPDPGPDDCGLDPTDDDLSCEDNNCS